AVGNRWHFCTPHRELISFVQALCPADFVEVTWRKVLETGALRGILRKKFSRKDAKKTQSLRFLCVFASSLRLCVENLFECDGARRRSAETAAHSNILRVRGPGQRSAETPAAVILQRADEGAR